MAPTAPAADLWGKKMLQGQNFVVKHVSDPPQFTQGPRQPWQRQSHVPQHVYQPPPPAGTVSGWVGNATPGAPPQQQQQGHMPPPGGTGWLGRL